jgi:hypothetical protein
MGTLFKAALGFAIAVRLLGGPLFPPGLDAVKRDIAAARPELRLAAWLAPHSGTIAPKTQAHRLHP